MRSLAAPVTNYRRLTCCCVAALALKSLIFAPIGIWPLAFVCLVPWLIAVGAATHAPRVYAFSYLFGAAFFLINMRWLYEATGWGYLALSVYLAAYFPLMACPLRQAVRRRGWPLAIAFPIVWTGAEMLRAVALSGFPWFFLSHSAYRVLTLIQVSDLVGAYGVSFVIAAVNGAIADLLFMKSHRPGHGEGGVSSGGSRFGIPFAAGLMIFVLIYGRIQLRSDTVAEGPRVAVLQGDFLSLVGGDEEDDSEKRGIYMKLLEMASSQKPDLYLLPETPWMVYLNAEGRDIRPFWHQSFMLLRDFAIHHRAYVVTGSASLERTPFDLLADERRYNSAAIFTPDGAEPGRYDKVHVVYFGETVPFRFGRFRFLYLWMNRMMPFSGHDGEYEYSIFAGKEFRTFSMSASSLENHSFRFGIPICYEDVMPYVSREFVRGGQAGKRADFLLNISNDGWFGRGVQQPQHLAICVFRAVENRVGIARAVNTGISGFVQPTGRLHDLVTSGAFIERNDKTGFSVARVGVDSRYTLYSRYGDVFAWTCAALWLVLYVDYWVTRAKEAL